MMIKITPKQTKARVNIPAWLTDPDGVSPCICGRPLEPGEPAIVASGELGMRRWFHESCWDMMVGMSDDEEDDDE